VWWLADRTHCWASRREPAREGALPGTRAETIGTAVDRPSREVLAQSVAVTEGEARMIELDTNEAVLRVQRGKPCYAGSKLSAERMRRTGSRRV
jgi:hypothetical protein